MTAPSPVDLEMASRIPVFSGLKSQGLEVLLEKASIVNLRAGHVLFRQGEPAQAFFIVMEGWIKLYRVTAAGDEAVLNVLSEGESFAEAVTFTSGRYPATACAVTPARVMVISADHVIRCIREMPDIAIAMIASTSLHLHRMVQQIEQLMAQSATQRVAEFLTSLAPCARGPCTIALPYDKSLIAGRLGLKPEIPVPGFCKAAIDRRRGSSLQRRGARHGAALQPRRLRPHQGALSPQGEAGVPGATPRNSTRA